MALARATPTSGDADAPALQSISFAELSTADLVVDAVYEGGNAKSKGDDPLAKLIPGCGNSGGFRPVGSRRKNSLRLVVIYTTGSHPDWPDSLDRETGLFTYFGDNRKPGKTILDTPRGGNAILEWSFEQARGSPAQRGTVVPFLVFAKANPVEGRAVRFLGSQSLGARRYTRPTTWSLSGAQHASCVSKTIRPPSLFLTKG